MIPYNFYFVGFQLVVLAYTAQSYVMLTANKEDIKRIAQRFVSDAFADKIAEFVIRATEHMVTNLSEEKYDKGPTQSREHYLNQDRKRKERDDYSHNESGETNKVDISYEKQKRTTYDFSSREYDKATMKGLRNGPRTYKMQLKNNQNEKNKALDKRFSIENGPKRNEKYIEDINNKYHPNTQISTSTKETKAQRQRNNEETDSDDRKSTATSPNSVMKKSIHKFEKQRDVSKSGDERLPYPKYIRTQQGEEVDKSNSYYDSEPSNDTKSVSDELSIESTNRSKSFGLTTRKPSKTEFDQYDNTRYPKAVYVATSGNMMMPKIIRTAKDQKKPYWESFKSKKSRAT